MKSQPPEKLKSRITQSQGFTLLEMSIVLLIMGLLLGSVMRPMGSRIIERQRSETLSQLSTIREALIGYASVHHRLPCPITTAAASLQSAVSECNQMHGFVPAAVLGITGHYDATGLLVDSWGAPIQYHVSLSDADSDGLADFTTAHEMRDVSMQRLVPELEVCNNAACSQLRANRLPAVLVSTGASQSASSDEAENQNSDNRFVSRDIDMVGADQFDDIVLWLSGNILYTRLLQAQVLP